MQIKKETLEKAFFCEFCETFKNVFFTERLLVTAFKIKKSVDCKSKRYINNFWKKSN